VLDFDIILKPV